MKDQNPDFKYFFPELHKSKRWHLHGLGVNCDKLQFEKSGIVKNGKEIYNINKRSFKYGFTTATQIESTVMNSMLDYAVELELVSLNIARNVRRINKHKFADEVEKTVEKQIYVKGEKDNIITLALQQYQKTKNTANLAVCMNFYLGLQLGELVALRTDDFSKNLLTIQRQEIKTYEVIDGKSHHNGYAVADYTKTKESTKTILCVS